MKNIRHNEFNYQTLPVSQMRGSSLQKSKVSIEPKISIAKKDGLGTMDKFPKF